VRGVIPDFRMLQLLGRQVWILFESNVHNNPDVQEGRRQLAGWMTGEGARVLLASLPLEPSVNGPDDAAAKHGAG
jgi:hypothetical protein